MLKEDVSETTVGLVWATVVMAVRTCALTAFSFTRQRDYATTHAIYINEL